VAGSLHTLLPVPAVVIESPGVSFRLRPGLRVIVEPGSDAVARVGHQVAELLGTLLGQAPSVRAGAPAAGDVVLRLTGPTSGGDEAYTLDISAESLTLSGAHPAGLFRGLQTVRQLLPPTIECGQPTVDWELPGGQIIDHPRYPYRGMMLDVVRHFFDVATIKRLIDLLALHKFNHLHLHLTDDQGWRIAIRSWPRLHTVSGVGEVGDGPGGYYTQDDYREIVAYAARHHITIVPAVDLPGHTNAALVAYPELAGDGVVPKPYSGTEVGFSSLVAERDLTYVFLDDILGELAALTSGPYLHIGGDEALSTSRDDYSTIVTRAQEIVAAHGKTAIAWHEAVGSKLAPSTILQFWGTSPDAPEVIAAAGSGARLIMSPANRSYVDMKYDEQTPLGLVWAGHISVADAYDWDPASYLPGLPDGAVLGLESPLWTETVTTREELEFLAFPRLAALAELGWSPAANHDWIDFRRRLGAQAPRWEALGVAYHRSPEIDWVRP
jgi:hexosaminidase